MDPHLANLSVNNDPPSETIIHEVKEFLATPLQELAEIDSEISQLQSRLQLLTEKRDTIQKSIDKYIAILSPIRRLPPDILHEIFYRCLSIHRNPIIDASEAPVLLTRVCNSWRSLALSSPRLWAQLHITFCDNYRVRDPEIVTGIFSDSLDQAFRVHAEKTLKKRCDVVKEWLGRSGVCRLSISIYYSSGMWDRSELESLGHITLELFRNLLLFKQRWREIELSVPLEIYRKFEAMVPVDELHMLSIFKGTFHEIIPASPFGELDPIAFLRAPNLEKISLGGSSRIWRLNDISLVTAWAQKLTYICCHSPLSIVDLFGLLKLCHRLEHCKFNVTDANEPLAQDPNDPRLLGSISLPHLQSLCIIEDIPNPATMTASYDSIDAPSLSWIDYQTYIQPSYEHELTNPDFLPSILVLLSKSSQLKKLTIDPKRVSPWNMRRIFQLGTHLTHLVIGQEPVGPFRTLSHGGQLLPGGFASGQEIFLGLLTIGGDDSENSSETVSRKEILLPNLEVLEISAPYTHNISDEQLVDFVWRGIRGSIIPDKYFTIL